MGWKCMECGHANSVDTASICEGCGGARDAILVLESQATGKAVRMSIRTDIGRQMLKSLADDDSKFASDPQFSVTRDAVSGGWTIQHSPGAKNPTFAGGAPLPAEPIRIGEGTVISIGPEKMKLTVRFEYQCE